MPLKGQTLSDEAITRMKKSKVKRLQSKFKWDHVESYLDVVIDNGSRNRRIKHITLRVFKEAILSGKSLRDIKKEGISKHLVGFFSNLCQGKIVLSKEDFVYHYVEKGISLEEIAKLYDMADGNITFLRQLYEINAKGPKYQERKRNEKPLTDRQLSILYGTMMGDAQRFCESKSGHSEMLVRHSEKQKDYLLWLYKEFENIANEKSLQCNMSIDHRSERENLTWRFYTRPNSDIEECNYLFYKSGDKEVSEEVLAYLTPLSIAVWFMDDGKSNLGYSEPFKEQAPNCTFCTESFSKESCMNIKNWFSKKFAIEVSLTEKERKDGNMGYRIFIGPQNIDKFFDIIRPHILPMFAYKIDYHAYAESRKDARDKVPIRELKSQPIGTDFNHLSVENKELQIDKFVFHYQDRGIEYLVGKPDRWKKHVQQIFKYNTKNLIEDKYFKFSNIGSKFLLSHFPHFWDTKAKGNMSLREIFNSKKYLSDIIRKIISTGYFPDRQKVLKKLRGYRGNKAISNFMPSVAKAIYDKYCNENSMVLDFCAGWGGRLVGAMASKKVVSYTGIDIEFKTYSCLCDLYKSIRDITGSTKEASFMNQDSIVGMNIFRDKMFDFCFTSPPYFDTEEYSNESQQSCIKYSNYNDWFNYYLIGSIKEAIRISKKVAINIANTGGYTIADDLRRWMGEEDISFEENSLKIPFYGDNKFEPIFIIE